MKKDYHSIGKRLIREFGDIALIDKFLENLEDLRMLNKKGKKLRKYINIEDIVLKDKFEKAKTILGIIIVGSMFLFALTISILVWFI